MTSLVDRLWYGRGRPLWPLWPLAWLFRQIAGQRRRTALNRPENPPLPVPVIVVGNITAGGTGKSPLTAWLVVTLREQGWSPVVITRGYGGKSEHYPLLVSTDTDPAVAGDEPVMLAQQCACPVVVDPRRYRAAQWAVSQALGDVLICDDGLQHYALPRDIEIAVFDGQRGTGNGAPIPVGPLREPVSRLAAVDYIVTNGRQPLPLGHSKQHCMELEPTAIRHLSSGELQPVNWLNGRRVRAVAGIGNPKRFFDTLTALGADVRARGFADHHSFRAGDLETESGEALVMTAKDAVKCRQIAPENTWVLDVSAVLPRAFSDDLQRRILTLAAEKAASANNEPEPSTRSDHG